MGKGRYIDVHQDILMYIILKLPFESILACKRVSKQWKNPKSMIVFIDGYNPYCALIRPDQRNKITGYPLCTAYRLKNIDNRGFFGPYHRLLPGSSDGIFCVKTVDNRFLVYSLFTGASFQVENTHVQYNGNLKAYGFGYDRYDDDYKIFMVCDRCHACPGDNSPFRVYSFRDRSWKKFEGYPDYVEDGLLDITIPEACSFNGVLHWCAVLIHKSFNPKKRIYLIVTYDLNTRGFGKITMPNGCRTRRATVSELDGRLCCVFENESEVWVMEVYDGVGESWTKLLSFDHRLTSRNRIVYLSSLAYTSMYVSEDGKKTVLFVFNEVDGWFWYDLDKNEVKYDTRKQWIEDY